MKKRLALFSALILLLLSPLALLRFARADGSKPGLFMEQVIGADGVNVRRIRDTGEGVVCYVAKARENNSRSHSSDIVSVGISCVREKP